VTRVARKGVLRTCIGCRASDSREGLLRLTLSGDPPQVQPDLERRLGGRGASIHPRRACFSAAVKRGAFKRAWMRGVAVTLDQLVSKTMEQYRRRIEKLLLSARRKNSIVVHIDAVRRAIQVRQAELLVVAEDAVEYISNPQERSGQLDRRIMFFGTEESLGRLFGDGATSVVALIDRAIARELTRAAECTAALAEGA
jgi:predicted RNA-binding protein YlxR (DUF448 family)